MRGTPWKELWIEDEEENEDELFIIIIIIIIIVIIIVIIIMEMMVLMVLMVLMVDACMFQVSIKKAIEEYVLCTFSKAQKSLYHNY